MIKTSSSADWLDLNQTAELEDLARQQGWIGADERVVAITKPGEGNMNFVVRIVTDCSSFIVKQARPWVEKYPQIAAPTERILAEMSFYQLVHQRPLLSGFFPQLVHTLVDQHILVLEDLGVNADFTFIYTQPDRLRRADILQLTGLLSRLHQAVFSSGQIKAYPQNMALRRLNHEHFYVFPFLRVNGLKLDEIQDGLASLAEPIKTDDTLLKAIAALGERYLEPGLTLLHGDFIPSSWLKVKKGIAVIDPEFSFFGPAEFDLGVMVAHLHLADVDVELIDEVLNIYEEPAGFDESLRQAFTGIEMLRRLIGIAQLPLTLTVERKKQLLEAGATLIKEWYNLSKP